MKLPLFRFCARNFDGAGVGRPVSPDIVGGHETRKILGEARVSHIAQPSLKGAARISFRGGQDEGAAIMSDIKTFLGVQDVGTLAQAIVDRVAGPLVVLDSHLRVIAASRSFYLTFRVDLQNTQGRLLYDLGEGQWNIAEFKTLLEKVLPEHGVVEGYEVDRVFPGLGRRIMRLSARQVFDEGNPQATFLLTLADVTEQRAMEQEMKELMWQKELLLEEMQHRVANSLTIIASILMLKARTVRSEETRQHLQDAHSRVM